MTHLIKKEGNTMIYKAISITNCDSSPAPKEYWDIPEIKKARPQAAVETSLQQLSGYPNSVVLVQWMGAKNGFWYPASEVFRITKIKRDGT
jgi:hypothetical protein